MKLEPHRTLAPAPPSRALAAAPASHGGLLRAVLLAAVASGVAACDPISPRGWPDDVTRGARRVGVFLHVIEEPVMLAGVQTAVHPVPVPSTAPAASAAPTTSASVTP
ncbi:MAG: hypothetical protein HYV09_37130 [Deltaproteobacteria bacterium]|nr:hypothetical protein [Deltaproteobacteria bacterium]